MENQEWVADSLEEIQAEPPKLPMFALFVTTNTMVVPVLDAALKCSALISKSQL
jgi:hypothetical protein